MTTRASAIEAALREMIATQEEWEQSVAKIIGRPANVFPRAIDRAKEAFAMPADEGWRPISEVPKDGTHFLAYEPDGSMYRMAFGRDDVPYSYCGQHVTITPEPTHFRPLPPPPETSDADR